jgi:L,D-transpeptidase-like protein
VRIVSRVLALLSAAVMIVLACASGSGQARPAAFVDRPIGFPAPATAAPTHVASEPRPCARQVRVCVDRKLGQAWLQHDGRITYGPVRVATGTPRHPTPRGRFHVAWKDRSHHSSIYGIRMPYSVFFASGGIAFHEGPTSGQSHGCVHLRWRAARHFFAALHTGDVVVVR